MDDITKYILNVFVKLCAEGPGINASKTHIDEHFYDILFDSCISLDLKVVFDIKFFQKYKDHLTKYKYVLDGQPLSKHVHFDLWKVYGKPFNSLRNFCKSPAFRNILTNKDVDHLTDEQKVKIGIKDIRSTHYKYSLRKRQRLDYS